MTCRYCGELLAENAKFCTHCGAQVETETVQQEPSTLINPAHSHEEHCAHGDDAAAPEKITFLDAIASFFTRYTDFRGRSRRSEYWWVYLFNILVGTAFAMVIPDLTWIWSVITLVPGTALAVRRLHDIGKSGWWLFITLVPLAGPIILLVFLCTDSTHDNQWGPNPKL